MGGYFLSDACTGRTPSGFRNSRFFSPCPSPSFILSLCHSFSFSLPFYYPHLSLFSILILPLFFISVSLSLPPSISFSLSPCHFFSVSHSFPSKLSQILFLHPSWADFLSSFVVFGDRETLTALFLQIPINSAVNAILFYIDKCCSHVN